MSATLYDLAVEYEPLVRAIEEAGGELTPELEDAFDAIAAPLEEKLDAIAAIIREFEAGEMIHKREAAHQERKASVKGNGAKRLKNYVKACMKIARIKNHHGFFDITICKNPASAKWTGDPNKIPDAFRRERLDVSFDSAAALAAHKRGETLPDEIKIAQGDHTRIS